jgi:hypothetical protein
MEISVPEAQTQQLLLDYQKLLVEYLIAQHRELCPVCPSSDSTGVYISTKAGSTDVYVDPDVEADSVHWKPFAREYLMKFVRPTLYAVRRKSVLLQSPPFANVRWHYSWLKRRIHWQNTQE